MSLYYSGGAEPEGDRGGAGGIRVPGIAAARAGPGAAARGTHGGAWRTLMTERSWRKRRVAKKASEAKTRAAARRIDFLTLIGATLAVGAIIGGNYLEGGKVQHQLHAADGLRDRHGRDPGRGADPDTDGRISLTALRRLSRIFATPRFHGRRALHGQRARVESQTARTRRSPGAGEQHGSRSPMPLSARGWRCSSTAWNPRRSAASWMWKSTTR
jgi:hypothetical protein